MKYIAWFTEIANGYYTQHWVQYGAAGASSQVETVDVRPDSGWHSYAWRESPHVRLHGETIAVPNYKLL